MSETKYTPGPWRTSDEFNHESVVGPDRRMVADCAVLPVAGGDGLEANRSNARLIAAAPDMAEALKACIDALRNLGAHQSPNMIGAAALTEARAALAKARGQA